MTVLVDTSVFIASSRPLPRQIRLLEILRERDEKMVVSTIVVYELLAGTSRKHRKRNRRLLESASVVNVDAEITERAILLHDQLQRDRFRMHVATP